MPQRICSRKAPLLKSNTKRISKKSPKFSLNGSNSTLSSLKLSTPSNVISKVKQSESIGGKWKIPSKKMRNTEYGRLNGAQHLVRQNDVSASQMYDNDASVNSVGKSINICIE